MKKETSRTRKLLLILSMLCIVICAVSVMSFTASADTVKLPGRTFASNDLYKLNEEITPNGSITFEAELYIPEAYRNNLSKDHIAAIAVLRIDPGQNIPFWSLVNGMPVIIRFNNRDYNDVKPEEYMQLKTPKGLDVPENMKDYLYFNNRK